MKLKLVFLGKTKNPHYSALIKDYCRRIRHFTSLEVVEKKSAYAGPDVVDDTRGKRKGAPVVLLDAAGKAYTSEEFAGWLAKQIRSGQSQLIFLLGGAEGFPEETKKKATTLLSLSKLTMPHELARVVLVEQLYRALALLRNHPYPK